MGGEQDLKIAYRGERKSSWGGVGLVLMRWAWHVYISWPVRFHWLGLSFPTDIKRRLRR